MLPDTTCDPIEPCCDCLYDSVRALVDAAATAVEDCIGELCKDFGRFVSIGEPQGFGDFVAGWLATASPQPSPATRTGSKQLMVPKQVETINIRLMESGFPMLDTAGGRILLPATKQIDYASVHFYSHVETAWRAMLNIRESPCSRGCATVNFVNHSPMIPQFGHAAWNFVFQATIGF